MIVVEEGSRPQFVSNDGCLIREVLHPGRGGPPLPYSLALAEVAPGARTYRHRLKQPEVYYMLAGHGRMHVDAETRDVGPGDAIYIPPAADQWIENCGDVQLKFLALVSPPWRAEDDRRFE